MASSIEASPSAAIAVVAATSPRIAADGSDVVAAPGDPSPAERVERWRKSGDAHDAFAAFGVLQACVAARRAEAQGISSALPTSDVSAAQACADLSPGQVSSRIALLEQAATAGVHGALDAFVREGPAGDGVQVSDLTPAAAREDFERKRLDFERAGAQTGDRDALRSLAERFEASEPQDLDRALTYWTAQNEIARRDTGRDAPFHALVVARLSRDMTAERATLALETGRRLAASPGVEPDAQTPPRAPPTTAKGRP